MVTLIRYISIFLLLSSLCQAQDFRKDYTIKISMADSLYRQNKFYDAGKYFNQTFRENLDRAYLPDRYKAACAWAMALQPDSAFFHLFRIEERTKYDELSRIENESAFRNLYTDARWQEFSRRVRHNKDVKEKNFNRPLISQLDTMLENDQRYRRTIQDTIARYGIDSEQIKRLNQKMITTDSINIIKVSKILEAYGWPGTDVIDQHGNTMFLVIQHADPVTQKKYLPLVRQAVKSGMLEPSSLGLLEDRIAIYSEKCQVYGTQISYDNKTNSYYVSPLIDPANVDLRRKDIGLGPISEYLNIWHIKWNKAEYKKELIKLLGKKYLKAFSCFN